MSVIPPVKAVETSSFRVANDLSLYSMKGRDHTIWTWPTEDLHGLTKTSQIRIVARL